MFIPYSYGIAGHSVGWDALKGEVMFKGRRIPVFALLLGLPGFWSFAGTPEPAVQAKPAADTEERHVKLDGQPNFRDLGGYSTTDGRRIRRGQIYRSGQLSSLSDQDLATLEKLKIRTVVDLRGTSEVQTRGKDRLPEGVRGVSYPIEVTAPAKGAKTEPAPAPSSAIPNDLMSQATQSIILDRTDVYAALIRELAEPPNRPLVFHCTAGKDRAGIGAAIVLTLLGVPWETVREDYVLSNYYRKDENDRELKNIRDGIAGKQGIPPDKVDMTSIEAMFYVKPEYLDAARQAVIGKYGSMESYIREGLGISDKVVAKLRNELLE
jgi:protein-tyrosine phosphatase